MTIGTPAFFRWEHHPFVPPPELQAGSATQPDVIVAGAGPVGLTAALSLAQQGIKVLLLEARDCLSENSRTLAVTRRSVQILDRLGVARRFEQLAITRERNYLYRGAELVYSAPYEHSDTEKHPDISVLQQPWTEKVLLDAVAAHPLIDLRWLSPVTGVTLDDPARAQVTVSTQAGEYTVSARYVVAADGARGAVRRCLGLKYQEIAAGVVQRNFIICDFERKSSLPVARRLWVNPPHRPGTSVILHKQPFDTWRLDYSLMEDEDLDEAMKPENVERQIRAQLELLGDTTAEDDWRLVWVSAYRPMSRSLPSYRHGPVFFAGDAAHQTPIFGGRGMNQGMLDAANLAWKLSFVLQGHAPPRLLDSYDAERRPVIVRNLLDIAQATLCMTATTKGAALMRNAAIDLLPAEAFVRRLIDAFNANRSESLLTPPPVPASQGVIAGSPLPDGPVRIAGTEERRFLHDLLKPHALTLLYFSGQGQVPAGLRETFSHLKEQAAPCHAVCVAAEASEAAADAADAVAFDIDGITFAKLDARDGTCLIIRPDGYVGARLEHPTADGFLRAWRHVLGES